MTWTDAQISDLKFLWLRGDTAAQISRAIGKSKNAVIGMAHRLKLPGRPSPIKRNPKPPASRRVYETRTADTPMPPERKHDGASYIAAKPLKLAAPGRQQTKRPCQFPMWPDKAEPTHEYCGKPCQAGSSYCAEHHRRCYHKAMNLTDEQRHKLALLARIRNEKRRRDAA